MAESTIADAWPDEDPAATRDDEPEEEEMESDGAEDSYGSAEPSEDEANDQGAEHPHEIIFFIGPSGSGKTSAVRGAIGSRKFVVVNDRKEDSPFRGRETDWDALFKTSNRAVVVEDFVNASEPELRNLRELVNVKSRQRRLTPVYLIAHSLVGTGISSLLPFATKLVFSSQAGTSQSVSRALNHYGFSKEQREKAKQMFSSMLEPYQFFEIDVRQKTFGPFRSSSRHGGRPKSADLDVRSDSERRQASQHTARNLLCLLPDSELAFAIFHLILPYLPRSLRPEDLTVLLHAEKTGRPVRISIVDYIGCLLNSDDVPADELASFHDFIGERVVIPRLFQKNKHLLSRINSDKKTKKK